MPRRKIARRGCPFDETKNCPLYWAMHDAGGGSCDDGLLHEGGCGVDRGTVDFEELFAAMPADRYARLRGIACRPILVDFDAVFGKVSHAAKAEERN